MKLFVVLINFVLIIEIHSQEYYGIKPLPPFVNSELFLGQIDAGICECSSCCSEEFIGLTTPNYYDGLTVNAEGRLFSLNYNGIFEIDPSNGSSTLFFPLPLPPIWPIVNGFVAGDNGIFYTIREDNNFPEPTLIEINTVTGTITDLGNPIYEIEGDITKFNGEYYYKSTMVPPIVNSAIIKLDITNPANSQIVVEIPVNHRLGLSATSICSTLVMADLFTTDYLLVNLIDGALTSMCATNFTFLTSIIEYQNSTDCPVELDLDCNDSSGATDADYNAEEFDCLSNPVAVSDDDIGMLYDAIIEEMTIGITGSIPDDPFEFLISTESVQNIGVSGDGTTMITLTNAGGAKSTDFKDALRLIRYNNTALLSTGGLRTVEVQFTTEAGSMSNVATAFIQVNELTLVDVDLGPDQESCEGETATFDAGNPGAIYQWSSGETTQIITAGIEDQYIVTVSDGMNCPNQDTVELDILPVIHISLTGDPETCDNVQASLTINTDATFPIDVEITSNPGSAFTLSGITGNFSFTDLISDDTEYTITNVVPSQAACIEITDPGHTIDVYPSYVHSFEASICDGDSIWIGFYWETEAGVYENTFETFDGCDSVVTTTVTVLPAIQIAQQGNTCDSAAAGIFVEYLDNPNGCDTVITTTVTLLASDTTYITSSSCRLSETGVFTDTLSNQEGCDSLVISQISWTPPADTTFVNQTSCDSAQLGIFQQMLSAVDGCDSLVITTVEYSLIDTTYSFATSCDSAEIGVSEQLYTGADGCDSLSITTVTAGNPDTSYAFTTSCDSSSLGVIEMHFNNQAGCDSVVFLTVAYAISDYSYINSSTCDADAAGVFVDTLINRFGCDSIVTTSVELLPSHIIFQQSSTCDENQAGVYTDSLTNIHGCDSIITTTIELLPSDETFLFGTTCRSSEAGTFITTLQNQFGCDSVVTLTVDLIAADTTSIITKTCDPGEVGSMHTLYTNQAGCDSLVIESTELYSLPQLELVASDYNGYGISCLGANDGSASVEVMGVQPWTYMWSTGSDVQTLTGLSAGAYAATVTDGNGCTASGEVMLFEPDEFAISFTVTHPDCFDHREGAITIEQTGGVEPVRYSIDEVNYQSSPVFDQLSGGTYTVTSIDANDCEVKEILWINVPLMVHVELPDDQMAFPGDTVIINAIVNVPYDSLASVVWGGLNNPACQTCLSQSVAPVITTTYSVTVTSLDGCSDEDAMTLFLERDDDVYVPNVFSPNGDGVNDVVFISAGSSVEEILEFVVFDRWGNVVHEDDYFKPNDASHAWDGTMKQKNLNPGVFAYKVIVQFTDGTQDVRYGDITLMR